jgi:hypothetical protein
MQTKDWFDLSSEIRRRYAARSWIPLRLARSVKQGKFGQADYSQIYEGAHSLLVPLENRATASYGWSDDSGDHQPLAYGDAYKPVDVYQHQDKKDLGVRLVLKQSLPGMKNSEWYLNQDLVFALSLMREGDKWLRPHEGYIDVVRLSRDEQGEPVAMEIRAEFLRDYLEARQAALRVSSYRERDGMISPDDARTFVGEQEYTEIEGGRLSRRAWETDDRGSRVGGGVSVMRVFRTDVDPLADVPILGNETDLNTKSEHHSFVPPSSGLWRAIEEYWRDEWVEPAKNSLRVRRDKIQSSVSFIVDADGSTMYADELNYEDVGRWLWFNPAIIPSILQYRGNVLQWYTRFTGAISTPTDPSIHFGINEVDLVTIYAEDVASLSEWERKLWAGHNVSPEGGVSRELLSAQVDVKVADTKAPEAYFSLVIDEVDSAFAAKFGQPLFRKHDHVTEISSRIHRFRALEKRGLFELAKDVTRLTADLMDTEALRRALGVDVKDKRGSLKLLESVLAQTIKDEHARHLMGAMFGAYELRLADAHLPKTELESFLKLLEIGEGETPLAQGLSLMNAVVTAWSTVALVLRGEAPNQVRRPEEGR